MPVVMWVGALLMVRPGRSFRRANGIPRQVVRDAERTPEARRLLADSVQKVRDFAAELELMNPLARRTWALLFGPPARPAD
jgi:hypothetical protein